MLDRLEPEDRHVGRPSKMDRARFQRADAEARTRIAEPGTKQITMRGPDDNGEVVWYTAEYPAYWTLQELLVIAGRSGRCGTIREGETRFFEEIDAIRAGLRAAGSRQDAASGRTARVFRKLSGK